MRRGTFSVQRRRVRRRRSTEGGARSQRLCAAAARRPVVEALRPRGGGARTGRCSVGRSSKGARLEAARAARPHGKGRPVARGAGTGRPQGRSDCSCGTASSRRAGRGAPFISPPRRRTTLPQGAATVQRGAGPVPRWLCGAPPRRQGGGQGFSEDVPAVRAFAARAARAAPPLPGAARRRRLALRRRRRGRRDGVLARSGRCDLFDARRARVVAPSRRKRRGRFRAGAADALRRRGLGRRSAHFR
mmetsp:Transcript_7341/g.23920  ORF Transcript_7341/g.23920 Transcript_7341/m.23920 type:complete len:246 (-) Transcript_7341:46-783(-)